MSKNRAGPLNKRSYWPSNARHGGSVRTFKRTTNSLCQRVSSVACANALVWLLLHRLLLRLLLLLLLHLL